MFPNRQFDIGEYWLIIRRYKWLLVLPSMSIFVGTILWSFSQPDIYRTSVLVLVEPQQVSKSYINTDVGTMMEVRMRSINHQVRSTIQLEQIIKEFGLVNDLQDRKKLSAYARQMHANIDVEIKDKDTFSISYKGKEPHTVMLVANKIASLFIDKNLKVRQRQIFGTREFLENEIQGVRILLEKQEKAISDFKQRYERELPHNQEANRSQLEKLQSAFEDNLDAIEEVRTKKQLLMQKLSHLQIDNVHDSVFINLFDTTADTANTTADTVNTTADTANTTADEALEEQLAQRRQALKELQLNYTENHPEVRRLKREIADLQTQLSVKYTKPLVTSSKPLVTSSKPLVTQPLPVEKTFVDSLRFELQEQKNWLQDEVNQLDIQMERLHREQAKIHKKIAETKRYMLNPARREQELMVLTRDYGNMQGNYHSLLNQLMQAELAENLEKEQKAEKVRILEAAPLPVVPWSPKRGRILVMGLVLGLGVGIGAVFLADYLDTTFHSPQALKEFTSLPVLATIPLLPTNAEKRKSRLKNRLFYVSCMLTLVVTITAMHLSEMRIDLLFARLLQVFKN